MGKLWGQVFGASGAGALQQGWRGSHGLPTGLWSWSRGPGAEGKSLGQVPWRVPNSELVLVKVLEGPQRRLLTASQIPELQWPGLGISESSQQPSEPASPLHYR